MQASMHNPNEIKLTPYFSESRGEMVVSLDFIDSPSDLSVVMTPKELAFTSSRLAEAIERGEHVSPGGDLLFYRPMKDRK